MAELITNDELGTSLDSDGVTPLLSGTVYDAFCRTAAQWPGQVFVHVPAQTASAYGIAQQDVTYADALARVDALRDAFHVAGYGSGQRAGLLVENRPDFYWYWLALNALGVSVVPINADFQVGEISYLLDNSDAVLVIALGSHHERIRDAAQQSGCQVQVMAPGDAVPPALQPPAGGGVSVQTECALLYTSGTTGQPKGCILPNEYFLMGGLWYRELGGYCAHEAGAERLVSPLPLVHMNAMAVSSMFMLLTGGTIVLLDRFHPSTWWQTVRESEATIIHYLGVMPAMLLGAPPSDLDKSHRVKFCFGAGVDRRHHAAFEARFGAPLIEGWAMTETGAGGCISANEDPRYVGSNCFGRPPRGVAWRIVDDNGNDVASDQPGELLVRWSGGDLRFGFFKGYLKMPEATEQAWADGWFHTGDIVRMADTGHMHFVDRKKNVIRRSGENISAVEVEGVLMQHADVDAVGVAPVPDPIRGDEVMACVVSRAAPGEALARQIADHCRASLAYFKAPGYIAFVDELPLTATQKVQRGGLRELAEQCLNRGDNAPVCFDLRELKKRA